MASLALLLLALPPALAEAPSLPCATPTRWAAVDPAPLDRPADARFIDKQHRDPYGAPHVRTSSHFAVHFGDHGRVAEPRVERLLDALEHAWSVQIDTLGHPAPYGTEHTYFNVYIGDSDPELPAGHGAAGYYTADREGWPMIVVSAETLDHGDFSDVTAAHELYHAVQGASRRFTYDTDEPGAWFWEASATWASGVVYPDHVGYSAFLGGYALLPHRRVDLYVPPSEGGLEIYHPYGAFVFLDHLARAAGSARAVAAVWREDGDEQDPLEALRAELAERGHDLDELWLDHLARNLTWDYPQGEVYRVRSEGWAGRFPEHDHRISGVLDATGTAAGWSPPRALRPERYGANNLLIEAPLPGTYTLEIRGQPFGTAGHPAAYGATLVVEEAAGPRYLPVPFDATSGRLVVDGLGDAERAWVVVGAWSPDPVEPGAHATFPYQVHLRHEPLPQARPPRRILGEAPSGGCASAPGPGPVGWGSAALALLLLLVRRRR